MIKRISVLCFILINLMFIYKFSLIQKTNVLNQDKKREEILKEQESKYIDDDFFVLIKKVYSNIEFEGKISMGETEKLDFYRLQYYKLLNNKKPIVNEDTGEELYINEYGIFSIDNELGRFDVRRYTYYFLDMDEDQKPEFGISDREGSLYIMKYKEETDQIVVWGDFSRTHLFILGMEKLWYSFDGYRGFIKLDKNGEKEYELWLKEETYKNELSDEIDIWYKVMLPNYFVESNESELYEHLKKDNRIIDKSSQGYYFRVTKDQYNVLYDMIFNAIEKSKESIKAVTFTYEEFSKNISS